MKDKTLPNDTKPTGSRLGRIDAYLQDYVEHCQIAGAITRVFKDGELIHGTALRWQNVWPASVRCRWSAYAPGEHWLYNTSSDIPGGLGFGWPVKAYRIFSKSASLGRWNLVAVMMIQQTGYLSIPIIDDFNNAVHQALT